MTAGNMPPVGAETLVSARDIGVRRSERWIIRHVDIAVPRGALVYVNVTGANGAGKSTCAKAVLGLIEIDEGAVRRAPDLAVGYVPQRLAISPTLPLTLRRVMTLTGRYPRREMDEALAAVGLDRLGNPPISTLSGGEFHRLLLARALLAGLGLALVTGPAGCFVVWRRLAYFGETIAHSSLLGVALAIVLQFDLVIGILISAALVALIMFYLDRRGTLPTDTLLGLLAHGGLALGLVILSFFPGMRIDLHSLLFGDILAVGRTDLAVIWGGGAVALGVLAWLWRPLLAATVDPNLASVAGLKPERARLIFGLLVAAIIAVAIKIVGILLIVALLVIPAATVGRFAPSPELMAAGAAGAGAVATVGGLYASATWDTPSGPSIVVTAVAMFVVTRVDGLRKPGQTLVRRRR